jgi:transcriptional regulator with XRE-family HTH domain
VDPKCEIRLKAPRPCRYKEPDECDTLGGHLRNRRLRINESQGCVAQKLCVETDTITNWELNRNEPHVHYVHHFSDYLRYNPLYDLAGTSLGKRIQQQLLVKGLTQREFANKFNVDPATISRIVGYTASQVNRKTSGKIMRQLNHKG